MAILAMAVHLTDPKTHRPVVLQPGEEPAPHLAALITAPSAWVDGKLPRLPKTEAESSDAASSGAADTLPEEAEPAGDATEDTKQAAKKTAARKPARGRTAAAEGNGGH